MARIKKSRYPSNLERITATEKNGEKGSQTIDPIEVLRLILTAGIATAFGQLFSGKILAILLVLLLFVIWLWHYGGANSQFLRLPRRTFLYIGGLLPILLFITAVWFFSPYFRGTERLRGIVKGIEVPISDFTWATNGSIVATPISESGDIHAIKLELALRADKPNADAGWGMDFLRWDWLLRITHDTSFYSKNGVSFYIRGEKGGEIIGVSMKSDRQGPSPSDAGSDEERVPLSLLGITITNTWQQVRVPFTKFYNFDKHRSRNLAFYTDATIWKSVGDSQVVYLKDIDFW